MSAVAIKLLEKCTAQGISLRPGEGFKLKVSPPPEQLPEDLREELKRHKAEVLALLRQSSRQEQETPAPVPQSRPASKQEEKIRAFLPRPLGQEDAVDPFLTWDGLFRWLIEHHPEHFAAIHEAEDTLRTLEQQGITTGAGYEAACHELLRRFEEARRLKLSQGCKIWLQ